MKEKSSFNIFINDEVPILKSMLFDIYRSEDYSKLSIFDRAKQSVYEINVMDDKDIDYLNNVLDEVVSTLKKHHDLMFYYDKREFFNLLEAFDVVNISLPSLLDQSNSLEEKTYFINHDQTQKLYEYLESPLSMNTKGFFNLDYLVQNTNGKLVNGKVIIDCMVLEDVYYKNDESNLYEYLLKQIKEVSEGLEDRVLISDLNPILKNAIHNLNGSEDLTTFMEQDDYEELIEQENGTALFANAVEQAYLHFNEDVIELFEPTYDAMEDAIGTFYKNILEQIRWNLEPNALKGFDSLHALADIYKYQPELSMGFDCLLAMKPTDWKTAKLIVSSNSWDFEMSEFTRSFNTNSSQECFNPNIVGMTMLSSPLDEKSWFGHFPAREVELGGAEIEKINFSSEDYKGLNISAVMNVIRDNNIQIELNPNLPKM